MNRKALWLLAGSLVISACVQAQDSVAIGGGFPGDAVYPYADATTLFGSEQRNNYVVDLTPFKSSWKQDFAIAPLVKTSKSSPAFFNSLMNAQAISRVVLKGKQFAAQGYEYWNLPGRGVNNDPGINLPGNMINTSQRVGNQFAVTMGEFGTTGPGQSYNGVVTSVVNYAPGKPNRLFGSRIMAAINYFDPNGNLSQFGMGMVDSDGHTMFRADGSGSANNGGLLRLTANNIFNVSALARNPNIQNVISSDYPAGLFDAGPTRWIVRNVSTTHNTPGLVPAAYLGTPTPLYIGSNFAIQYVRGFDFPTTQDGTHLAPPNVDHRGAVGYSLRNFPWLGSTKGTVVILAKDATLTNSINTFGIDAAGNVTGKEALILPAVVTDNETGFVNLPGANEFHHYSSQTAFRGGNGQAAVGGDRSGNMLVAAEVEHPARSLDEPKNYIAVCRRKPGGAIEWTMAGYCDGVGGKPIVDEFNNPIGQMLPLPEVTGGVPRGPSVSAPMIDSMGNVYFISALELGTGGGFKDRGIGLLRAVYNEANFSYRLELLCKTGDVFQGQNSKLKYRIDFIELADSNSISSGTAYSSNIMESAHAGMNTALIPNTRDPRTLGGIVFNAAITYDQDENGLFEPFAQGGPVDPTYNVLMYIGANKRALDRVNDSSEIEIQR